MLPGVRLRGGSAFTLVAAALVAGTVHAHVGMDQVARGVAAEIAKHPDDPGWHLQMARVHQEAHEWDAALAELDDAARLGGDPDVLGATVGQVYLDAGWPRMAKIEFDRVLARRSDAYGTLFDRGRAWRALGNPDEAARDFADAIAHLAAPQPEQVLVLRDVLVGAGRPAAAVTALDDGMRRLGSVPTLMLAACDLEVELGRYDQGLARLDALLAQGTPNPAWIARRGEILDHAGRHADAHDAYVKALGLIDDRQAGRRTSGFDDLRRRIETELARTAQTTAGRTRE
jgi:tetratricopeptide (TPR) repeat protein